MPSDLCELEVVRLKEGLFGLPAGTKGTIVHIYPHKQDWCEFETNEGLYTMPLSNLERVDAPQSAPDVP